MLFQTSLGVDIGPDQISMAYLKGTFRGVELADYDIRPVEKEKPIEERLNIARDHLAGFIRKNRIISANIFLGIPREITLVRFIELPLSVKEGLASALNYEMEKYIPFSVDEIYFDFQIIFEDREANILKVLLVVARKNDIAPFIGLVAQMGVEASGIEITSTAICNFFSPDPTMQEESHYAVIYVSHGHVEFDLVVDGRLHYSRSVIRPENRDDFHALISGELKALRETVKEEDGRLIVLFCDSEGDTEMIDRLGDVAGVDLRTPDLSSFDIPSCSLIPAYGLTLKGVGRNVPMLINLLPEGVRKKPNKWGYYIMMILSGLIILLTVAWGGSNIVHKRMYLNRLNEEIAHLRPQVSDFDRIKKSSEQLEAKINYLKSFRNKSLTVLDVLRELSLRLPESAWVRRLTLSGDKVNIEGEAESASKLIPALEASPLFSDVVFQSTITKGRAGKEYFRIGFKIKS